MEVHNFVGKDSWTHAEHNKKCKAKKSKTHEV